jgi:hypothetical protein
MIIILQLCPLGAGSELKIIIIVIKACLVRQRFSKPQALKPDYVGISRVVVGLDS